MVDRAVEREIGIACRGRDGQQVELGSAEGGVVYDIDARGRRHAVAVREYGRLECQIRGAVRRLDIEAELVLACDRARGKTALMRNVEAQPAVAAAGGNRGLPERSGDVARRRRRQAGGFAE